MTVMTDAGLRVVRRSYGGSVRRAVGEVVDVERMRMARQLESEGFLGRLPVDAEPIVVDDGRTFVSVEAAVAAGYKPKKRATKAAGAA